ncbi:hypothetical protein [Hymenobacter sp. CRA2]|uniref:hypothetical protein n=1 Tax=Hymenobacter sp. CRA2 TaxID=1955620 RepID=UPI0009902056|nr:hypothetical protein [Hymenobacter sp. CRA2]OON70812.1 hypothetical protein B0919_02020 [Hymenobacter sp. CRA2]
MRPFRLTPVLLGGLLLATAGGCQRESATRTEAAAPRPSTLTDETAWADSAAPLPASKRDWHRLARRTNANAPLIRYRAVRRPAALAAELSAPSEARLFDLTLKASEFFRIDPTQPAEVRGREGTVIRLAANALVDQQQRPVQEPVWVELKECFTLPELLLSDCISVGAGGEPMQTGGVLLVRATTGHGQALRLASGYAVELELPDEQRRGAHQLYHSPDRQHWAALPVEAQPESGPAYAQASTGGSSIIGAAAESSATGSSNLLSSAAGVPAENALRSAELGWLTCLRSWHPAGEAALVVPAEVDEHTSVRLVYPEAGVIIPGTPQADGYAFAGVPAQLRAVVVGLRYFNGSAYLAVQELQPGAAEVPALEFREAELADIEQALEQLR